MLSNETIIKFKPNRRSDREKEIFKNHCSRCIYYYGQKDENDEIVISYCSHYRNRCQEEGNTTIYNCPLENNY